MVTGFLRLLASPGVLLLAMTTTTLLVDLGGATDSDTTPTGGVTQTTYAADGLLDEDAATTFELYDQCSAEIQACAADRTCSNCVSASNNEDERVACHTFNTATTSTFGCEFNMGSACCLDDLNDLECLNNESFLEYYACLLEFVGCSGEITCDDTSSARATATPTSFAYDSTAVVVGLSCAFLVLRPQF